ncbi:MAG: FAD-dependent oxidoreductase [Planctomycetaceae bacterium]|nr:MAG: FAD-dependent oxidoreductase [Planctomycetaceae bacterium]
MSRLFLFMVLGAVAVASPARGESVWQSEREIPVVGEADVLVVGGTLGGVAAAVEASRAGAAVWLIAPRTYLGEDLCGTLRLWLDDQEPADGEWTQRLFEGQRATTPLQIKKTLEAALLEEGVRFLFGSFVTDVLLDSDGGPAAVIIANRAGRQAIRTKTLVDASQRATAARLAGAQLVPGTAWPRSRRIVLEGAATSVWEPVRSVPIDVPGHDRRVVYHQYEFPWGGSELSFAQLAEAEQLARDSTYREGQLRAAESLFTVWQDRIVGQRSADDWQPADEPELGHFQPLGLRRLFVLGGLADVPRDEVEGLLGASRYEALGGRVGCEAARLARWVPAVREVRPVLPPVEATDRGQVRETLRGLRPVDHAHPTITLPALPLPVLAEVDVVVVGGGTSGACAAIGAARRGARVLVIEYQEALGGVGTVGLITRPYHGRNAGFSREVPFPDKQHNVEHKMEWYRREIRAAGGQIWLGALGCGALVQDGRIRGVAVATSEGRGVVLADVVIDATGSADIAIAAGADSMYGENGQDIALQGTGLPMRPLDAGYVNSDYLLVDEADALDTWRALVGVRLAAGNSFDVGPLIQNRERRRVVGDHVLSYLDQIAGRTYPDSIVLSASNYDSHGYPSQIYFALIPHTEKTLRANHPAPGGSAYTPYRCLLPKDLEGILVIGLGISMHRDASAIVRMQHDMHNQGYAAGVAAAMAVRERCTPREIDVRQLQTHLVEIGNLPASVLTDDDSFPLPTAMVQDAVAALGDASRARDEVCRALAVVLTHGDMALPMLQQAFQASDGAARLEYAKVLGALSDPGGLELLIETLQQVTEWDEKILQGWMAEYAHLPTPVDALILALGAIGDPRAVPAILDKLETLDASVTLSHHRAVALALEQIGDPAAAEPLARLLEKPGMRGHVMTGLEPLYDRQRERRRREGPLREIVIARALVRCGDHQGRGEAILREYQQDIRGLFARHATAVLDAPHTAAETQPSR